MLLTKAIRKGEIELATIRLLRSIFEINIAAKRLLNRKQKLVGMTILARCNLAVTG